MNTNLTISNFDLYDSTRKDIRRLFPIMLFLVFSALAIYSQTRVSIFLYFLILFTGLYPITKIKLSMFQVREILLMVIIGLAIYGYLFKLINEVELWGDEIGVIKIANLQFKEISLTITDHSYALPLDYWNMWFWDKVVKLFPISYMEFIYRIPYMFYHIISSVLFAFSVKALLISSKIKISKDLIKLQAYKVNFSQIVTLTAFLLYFLNPLTFFYSIEVRFYSLALVGINVLLLLYIKRELTSLKYLPLSLLFCINSVYQFISFFILITVSVWRKTISLSDFFKFILPFLFLFVIISFQLNGSFVTSEYNSIVRLLAALKDFFGIQFIFLFDSILLSIFIFLAVSYGSETLRIPLIFVLHFVLLSVLALITKYSNFSVRSFLIVLPYFLLIFFISISRLPQKFGYILLCFLFILSSLWFFQTIVRLKSQNFFSKRVFGLKNIYSGPVNLDKPVIINLQSMDIESKKNYLFHLDSFRWYKSIYEKRYREQ